MVKKINPFYLTCLLTVLYLVFIIIIQYAKFEGKGLLNIKLMPGTKEQKELEPIEACLYSILLVFTWYFVMCLMRLSVRMAAKWEAEGAESSNSLF